MASEKRNRRLKKPDIKAPDLKKVRPDPETRNSIKRFVRRRYKEIIIVSVLFVFFMFSLLHGDRTMLLIPEKNITSQNAQAYVFTDSEYVDLEDRTRINYTVKEGQKVGANTKLSKDYIIETDRFTDEAIDVINWRLEHSDIVNRERYFKELKLLEGRINSAQTRYDKAKSSNDTANMNKNETELERLKQEQYMMQKSMKYVYADKKELNRIKKELNARKKSENRRLTTSNLNIDFSGNIFFERTGYEEVLNIKMLPSMTDEYFKYVDNYTPDITRGDVQIIKVINDEAAYVFAFLDRKTYVSGEDEAKKYNKSVKKNHNLKSDGEYYDYLLSRVDMLITYPEIEFADRDGNEYEGYLVDVNNYGGNKKVLAICVKKQFEKLQNQDKTKLDIYTDVVTVYKVPKSAIVKRKNKTYVYKMNKGNIRERVEVTVYKEDGGDVLLRPYNNDNLEDNMEIVVNPM